MIEWSAEGVLLSARRHGESSSIVEVFTAEHGLHAGVVRGGASRGTAPILQPGAQLSVTWRARLDEHLGNFTAEPVRARAGIMSDRAALAALNATCALARFTLPEREAHPGLYSATVSMLDALETERDWPLSYLRWESRLLDDTGFGLDLSRCAATGATEDLRYISPRTGRAVSAAGAGAWADRLLPLPRCLTGAESVGLSDLMAGLGVTGHFLREKVAKELVHAPLPAARERLVSLIARQV